MATTSLWHIEGRLKDLIAYVENPAKTNDPSLQDFFNVFAYAQNPNKTEQGEYVTAVNCVKEIALEQMILTKKQFGKDDGYIAWHGYQSFKPGEVTPEQCHKIGVQTAKELWGDGFQIIVTTHLDKDHLHNHFCFNSVGFRDGRKYNYSKTERKRYVEVSDRICLEHGLSVIQKPKKAPSRPVWEDEKKGKPTRYNIYREDIQKAMYGNRRIDLMINYLERLGYDVDFNGPKWKIKLHKYRYFTHLETLNPEWTPEYIRQNLGVNTRYGNHRAEYLPIEKLKPFEGHPFKVTDNEEMDQLVWSILIQGLLTPLVVRPLENGEYEVISGHRRLHACKKAGIETVPALIAEMDRDVAAIALVDSNLHREKILPSEKAHAYKLKMDALSRQGQRTDLTSRQLVGKLETADVIAENESGRQVQRYIRLTNLIPGILDMVDEGKIALTPAVELSYLTEGEQQDLLETMESEDCTPSLSQAMQMKQLSQAGQLDMDKIFAIMTQPKANQKEKISFRTDDVRKFFPKNYTAAQMQEVILKLLGEYQRKRQRGMER